MINSPALINVGNLSSGELVSTGQSRLTARTALELPRYIITVASAGGSHVSGRLLLWRVGSGAEEVHSMQTWRQTEQAVAATCCSSVSR